MASGTAVRAGRAFVELFANDDKLVRGLRRSERRLKAFGKSVSAAGKSILRKSTVALSPFVLSASIFANFSDQMLKVKAVASGTADEFERLYEQAKELGRTTSFSASEVASGMVELGRAGFRRREIDLAIAGVLDLSRATDTVLPEAAAIAGSSLRQFNLDATEMSRVVDVLTATANGSSQTLTDLGEALKPVAPIAAEAGETIEQVSAAIAVLANNGIRGSLAGTALARAYKNLSSDTVTQTLKGIGVSAVDADENLRPLAEILNEVGKATAGMGTAEKLNIFETLFGRGQASALKLARNGAVFDELLSKIQNSGGIAKKTAEEMDSGLGGAIRRLLSAIEGIAIAIGEAITPALMSLGKTLSAISGTITKFVAQNKKAVGNLFQWILAIAGVGAGLVGLGITLQVVAFAVGGLATLIPIVASVFGAMVAVLGAVLSPLAIIIVGFSSLAFSIESTTGIGRQSIKYLGKVMQAFGGTVSNVFSSVYQYLRQSSTIFRTATDFMGRSLFRVSEALNGLGETASLVFTGIRDAMLAGDFKLAADVLWKGLHLAFLQGTAPITAAWGEFSYGLTDAWNVVWHGIKSVMIDSFGAIQSIFMEAQRSLINIAIEVHARFQEMLGNKEIAKSMRMFGKVGNAILDQKKKQNEAEKQKQLEKNEADKNAMLAGSRDAHEQKKNAAVKSLGKSQKALADSIKKSADEAKKKKQERERSEVFSPDKPNVPSFSSTSSGPQGTFSSFASLMFGGNNDGITQGDKFLGKKVDQVVAAIEQSGALA